MTYKQVVEAREIRHWIERIIVPTLLVGWIFGWDQKIKNLGIQIRDKIKSRIQCCKYQFSTRK